MKILDKKDDEDNFYKIKKHDKKYTERKKNISVWYFDKKKTVIVIYTYICMHVCMCVCIHTDTCTHKYVPTCAGGHEMQSTTCNLVHALTSAIFSLSFSFEAHSHPLLCLNWCISWQAQSSLNSVIDYVPDNNDDLLGLRPSLVLCHKTWALARPAPKSCLMS